MISNAHEVRAALTGEGKLDQKGSEDRRMRAVVMGGMHRVIEHLLRCMSSQNQSEAFLIRYSFAGRLVLFDFADSFFTFFCPRYVIIRRLGGFAVTDNHSTDEGPEAWIQSKESEQICVMFAIGSL